MYVNLRYFKLLHIFILKIFYKSLIVYFVIKLFAILIEKNIHR